MIDLKQKWTLGFNDRGHGHGDYGVIVAPPEEHDPEVLHFGEVIVEQLDKELADHLIKLHNQDLERTNEINSELRL
jgi:hypothetical protein